MFKAPGRINLIGEHTDYNDGFVLPGAINYSIYFAIGRNTINRFRFYSVDFDSMIEVVSVNDDVGENTWAMYLLGIIAQIEKEGFTMGGIDCVFGGDIPVGAGLSSSAALESGFIYGLNCIFNFGFSKLQLAKMGQKAEHEYAGVMCGIMDQFASVFGKEGKVFKLDCRTLDYEYFDMDMSKFTIALVDTKVKHSLASSEYNTRRKECEEGVRILHTIYPNIVALRDANLEQLNESRSHMTENVYNRCSYVIEENLRVEKACNALEISDFKAFGKLMYESHVGLQHKYKVSCKELDLLVDATRDMDYVLGSRMMGGGFGGCTINLIKKGSELNFENKILTYYKNKTGIDTIVYFAELGNGAGSIN